MMVVYLPGKPFRAGDMLELSGNTKNFSGKLFREAFLWLVNLLAINGNLMAI